MIDILITELGSGGEIIVRNNDAVGITGYENQLYLAMFGGASWWGNGLLVTGDAQFQSQTEQALLNNPLTSTGLIAIDTAISNDLDYLSNITGTTVSFTSTIVATNRLDIKVSIAGKTFYLSWNPDSRFLTYSLIE